MLVIPLLINWTVWCKVDKPFILQRLHSVLTSSVTQLPRTLPHTVEKRSPVVKLDWRSNFFTLCIAGRNSSGPSNNLNLKPKLATYKYEILHIVNLVCGLHLAHCLELCIQSNVKMSSCLEHTVKSAIMPFSSQTFMFFPHKIYTNMWLLHHVKGKESKTHKTASRLRSKMKHFVQDALWSYSNSCAAYSNSLHAVLFNLSRVIHTTNSVHSHWKNKFSNWSPYDLIIVLRW